MTNKKKKNKAQPGRLLPSPHRLASRPSRPAPLRGEPAERLSDTRTHTPHSPTAKPEAEARSDLGHACRPGMGQLTRSFRSPLATRGRQGTACSKMGAQQQ